MIRPAIPARAALLLACLLAVTGALAMEPPAAVARHLVDSRLLGQGELRWFGLKVYEASLWTAAPAPDRKAAADGSIALDIRYARALAGEKIARASHDEITRMGFGDPQRRDRWLDAMLSLFPDVEPGDRLTGILEPRRGVSFYRNDAPLGSIDDPRFATAFFAIWLDPRTAKPELRRQLLGETASRAETAQLP